MRRISLTLLILLTAGAALAERQVSRRGKHFTEYVDPEKPSEKQVTFTIHDQNYQDENGNWTEEVEDFETGDATWDMKADKMNHRIWVKGNTARRWYPRRNVTTEYVDIGQIEYYTNRWRAISPGPLNHFLNKLYWESADLRVEITPLWWGQKFTYTLKSAQAPTRLRVSQTLVGLSEVDGKFVAASDGKAVGYLAPLSAVDASNANVPVTTTRVADTVEFSVDTVGYTLPITVDPSYVVFSTQPTEAQSKDTRCNALNAGGTYENDDSLQISLVNQRSFLQFDVSPIPSDATVNYATFTAFVSMQGYSGTPTAYSLHSNVSSWTEAGLSWLNYKAATAWPGSSGGNTEGTDYEAGALGSCSYGATYDLPCAMNLSTSRIAGWLTGSNYGLKVIDGASSTTKAFYSSNYGIATLRPKLDIGYSTGGGATGYRFQPNGVMTLKGVGTLR